MATSKPTENETELRDKIAELAFVGGASNSKYLAAQIMALITSDKQRLLQELMEQIPSKPKEADKTPKPVRRAVEEGFGFGDVGGVVSTTEDTGFTYTEQDQEDAAFECAQPYLEEVKSVIQNKLEGLS